MTALPATALPPLRFNPFFFTAAGCIDGKFRAKDIAEMTIRTLGNIDDLGEMVPLLVEPGGKAQDAPGAKGDTETAPLAALLDDDLLQVNAVFRNQVEGFSPVLQDSKGPFL
jgi:hypothetical protein